MDRSLVIRMALGIKGAANDVCCQGSKNWDLLKGIINTADAIVAEMNKQEVEEDGRQVDCRAPEG